MIKTAMNGDEALARGAMAAGLTLAASYPGSPSSATMEILIEAAEEHGFQAEWAVNERVALEKGIGVSMAGKRALICCKSVGLNVMVDPLMALNLTPVHGGLVILLGDDPGGYGSQNDQDTRPLIPLLEMPLMEPAGPAEAFEMMAAAFAAAEALQSVVIIRITRSFCQHRETVATAPITPATPSNLGLIREGDRFVPVPKNVVTKHKALHDRFEKIRDWIDELPHNGIAGQGNTGIVAAGFVHQKLSELLGPEMAQPFRVLKLSTIYPLPRRILAQFAIGCDVILVLEEIEPFVETHLKALAFDSGWSVEILGKLSGHVDREGELYRWQIQKAIQALVPDFLPARSFLPADEGQEIPYKKSYCGDSRYGEVLDLLQEAADRQKREVTLVGDPGCLVTVADRLDAKYAMGSAVAVAEGLAQSTGARRPVALFGDSSFFHMSLPAICNVAWNQSLVTLIVLDNGSTATSGYQPNPGVGVDARGRPRQMLNMLAIARACELPWAHAGTLADTRELLALLEEAIVFNGPAFLQIRIPPQPAS